MIGILALNAEFYPNNLNSTGVATQFHDRGFDSQYQYVMAPHTIFRRSRPQRAGQQYFVYLLTYLLIRRNLRALDWQDLRGLNSVN